MYVFFTYTLIVKIILSKTAKKQLDIVPDHIYRKYLYWIDLLQTIGLLEARKYKGFHDEPLKGERMPTALAGDRLECKLPKFH
jgi:hypothetical protein